MFSSAARKFQQNNANFFFFLLLSEYFIYLFMYFILDLNINAKLEFILLFQNLLVLFTLFMF